MDASLQGMGRAAPSARGWTSFWGALWPPRRQLPGALSCRPPPFVTLRPQFSLLPQLARSAGVAAALPPARPLPAGRTWAGARAVLGLRQAFGQAGVARAAGAETIAPARRAAIEAHLCAIERQHGVRVLYACESGSRAWGFSSPDSDYDVRFIYAHPLAWYLQVTPQRDVIEVPIADDLDISGWDLRKTLGLLKKGNAQPIEWFGSPIVYRAEPNFVRAARAAIRQTFLPERSHYHYWHLANGSFQRDCQGESLRLKRFLYVLRCTLAALWVRQRGSPPPVLFADLVRTQVPAGPLQAAIAELLRQKTRVGEKAGFTPAPELKNFVAAQLAELQQAAPRKTCGIDFSALDALLYRTLAEGEPTG